MTLDSWGALILAAGAGVRFGGGKLLADLDGMPVIRRTAGAIVETGFGEVIVATGADHAAIVRALDGLGCRIVPTPGWREGIAASIRAGIAALPSQIEGLFLFLGDMPLVPTGLCGELAALARASGYAARPVVGGRPGHPVCFLRAALPDLAMLEGDDGAARLLGTRRSAVARLETDAIGAILDIDRPQDLVAAERALHTPAPASALGAQA